jgi:DNA-binding LytR/AlgR family response regulator
MTLKCLVVDDEHINRMLLEDFIAQIPFLELGASCKNAFEAMKILNSQPIDLMLLDIQMPGLLGTDFLKSVKNKPMTILVTAYSEYALEGYELEVIDYLMKPLSLERFLKATSRAYELTQKNTTPPDAILLNVDYGITKIKLADITHIEGMKDYVQVFMVGSARAVITKMTMKSIEEKLPIAQFMRTHRSFIVNLDKIEKVKGFKMQIAGTELPISENSLEQLLQRIKESSIS